MSIANQQAKAREAPEGAGWQLEGSSAPAELLLWEAASSPLAGPIGALDEDAREALIGDFASEIRDYTDDEGVVFSGETYVAPARRQSRGGRRPDGIESTREGGGR